MILVNNIVYNSFLSSELQIRRLEKPIYFCRSKKMVINEFVLRSY